MLAQHADDSKEVIGELICITAFAGHTSSMEYLLDRSAEMNARDMNGRTALHYETHRGHEEVCNILPSRGAAIGIEDDNGSTPIDLAVRRGRRPASFIRCHMTELMQQIRRRLSLFASLSASGPPANHVSPLSVRKALTGHWEGDYEYLHLKEPRRESWTVDFHGIADTTEIRDNTMSEKSSDKELAFSSSEADLWGEFC